MNRAALPGAAGVGDKQPALPAEQAELAMEQLRDADVLFSCCSQGCKAQLWLGVPFG